MNVDRRAAPRIWEVLGRFFTTGLACALLHNAIMIAGDALGFHYAVSSVISFAVVVAFGYWMHSRWTFSAAARGAAPFARYVLIMSANLPLSIAGMFVCVDLGGLAVPLAAPVVTVALALFNYAGSRWALRAGRAPEWRA
jgi:putative flippase GtrA